MAETSPMTLTGPMPLFYRTLTPVDPTRHQGLRLPSRVDYGFAAGSNSIPLLIEEIPHAARSYPIVFSTGDKPMPLALVGLRDRDNLFLDPPDGPHGRPWRAGTYIPAYVRRYPFAPVRLEGDERMVVCTDETAVLGLRDGPLFFKEPGILSEAGQAAMTLCQNFEQQIPLTERFAEALRLYNLLDQKTATVTLSHGEQFTLTGFTTIDPAKFGKLSGDLLVQWRDCGWLALIYAHFLSMGTWQSLIDLTEANLGSPINLDERFAL